jgi:hypothetical protein
MWAIEIPSVFRATEKVTTCLHFLSEQKVTLPDSFWLYLCGEHSWGRSENPWEHKFYIGLQQIVQEPILIVLRLGIDTQVRKWSFPPWWSERTVKINRDAQYIWIAAAREESTEGQGTRCMVYLGMGPLNIVGNAKGMLSFGLTRPRCLL